jgi:hypothetical protein
LIVAIEAIDAIAPPVGVGVGVGVNARASVTGDERDRRHASEKLPEDDRPRRTCHRRS